MKSPCARRGFLLLPPAWLCCAALLAAEPGVTRVALVIDEPSAVRTAPWPVTTGVPFPRGELTSAEQCRLVDDTGTEQPLQTKVAATWDAARASIRWLTIDFVARPGRTYALEFGNSIQRQDQKTPPRIAHGVTLVNSGSLLVEFLASGPAGLGRIAWDANRDGLIDDSEVVAAGARDGDHAYVDQDGRRFTSQRDGNARQVVVEADGPVRTCVRVDGYYTGPAGERIVAYRTRYHLFAGLPLIKAIDEFRIVGSTKGSRFRDVALVLDLRSTTAGRNISFDIAGQTRSQPWGQRTASLASYQRTYRHVGNPEMIAAVVETDQDGQASMLAQTDRASEWLQVADQRFALTGSLRWFWQQFPKEWETTGDQLRLHLWSPRAGELDFGADGLRRFLGAGGEKYLLNWRGFSGSLSPITKYFYYAGHGALERGDVDGLGINKHHEVWWHVAPASQAAEGREYARLAAHPPLALASGEWNCGTDVFGPLAPRVRDAAPPTPTSPNHASYEAIVDRLFDLGRDAQDSFGDYGWFFFGSGPHYSYQWDAETKRHFADPRRFDYHTYQKETQFWWHYLRSGERKFYEWALPAENHWVDIAVAHVPTTYQTDWRGGEPETQRLHWPAGDWGIDSPLHYVRHHDTGEAWLRGASQFWGTYHCTLETTTLAYFLTGDERFRDVLEFWRDYWGDLAGKTSASTDVRPWHRQQAWFRPTPPGTPAKTWAELLRDYAPFASGTRHQQTLFFNLATLYEQTWDERIGQVLREFAAAFLDPEHRMGIWRSQDNGLPAKADAPHMLHYWSGALWKYARATGDPRMPDILRRLYTEAYYADPYLGDLGVYSNQHLGYAYYFTRDPRHLPAVRAELDQLLPHAQPLAKPEDLGPRIYNPYAMIRANAGVPRLVWALREAARREVATPRPPLSRPQRAPLAFVKRAGEPLDITLWGFDHQPRLLGPDGQPAAANVATERHASALQPFDRVLPRFEVYLHQVAIPAEAAAGVYRLTPKLELGVLALRGGDGPYCDASEPVLLSDRVWLAVGKAAELRLASAAPAALRVVGADGGERAGKVAAQMVTFPLTPADEGGVVSIAARAVEPVWFRVTDSPAWVALTPEGRGGLRELRFERSAEGTKVSRHDDAARFVRGRFGQAVRIVAGQEFRFADHVVEGGEKRRLSDDREGTLEFWIRREWDDRLIKLPRFSLATNGVWHFPVPARLPLAEWTHLAYVWRPYRHAPDKTCFHLYVNGHDTANYRNVKWEGYGDLPPSFASTGKWTGEFVFQAPPGAAFAIDDLRLSSTARYADRAVDFGGQQTFNPHRFAPPETPLPRDAFTRALLRFDGSEAP